MMGGSLNEVSLEVGYEQSGKCAASFEVPDLEFMECALEFQPQTSGQQLADDLRSFTSGIANLEDVTIPTARLRGWLTGKGRNPPRTRDWGDLANLAFWTVRNAAMGWSESFEGLSLMNRHLKWFEFPQAAVSIAGISLKLKPTAEVILFDDDLQIVAPEWFLKTRKLPAVLDSTSTAQWAPIAREVVEDYVRRILHRRTIAAQDKGPTEKPICHPALEKGFQTMGMKVGNSEKLVFDGYFRESDSSHSKNTPNGVAHRIVDNVKGRFSSMPEIAFVLWPHTVLGLIPSRLFD